MSALTLALAQYRVGRIGLHLFSLLVDGEFRWHWLGIKRELRVPAD